jgi:hypothetical protein
MVLYLHSPLCLHVMVVIYEILELYELERLLEIQGSNICDCNYNCLLRFMLCNLVCCVIATSCFHCQSTYPEDTILYKDCVVLN